MAHQTPRKKTHKEWRKEVKKLRRKKIRQKLAEERNKKAAEEETTRLRDPIYQNWLRQQKELEAAQLEEEERRRQEQEEFWMRRELLAQRQFREQQKKQEATIAAKETERLRIQKEFEKLQELAKKRLDERRKREEQAKKDHEEMLQRIEEYIEFGGPTPNELLSNVQSNPSKPLCPFFSKTNACRYGNQCSRNHIRPKLSKILFFPHFFSHIKLEQNRETEYGCDINLECSESELNQDYVQFFYDVIEELKKFGEIENFRACMNSQSHLRGNVLVEYREEKDALKAHMRLQGRYYASRQINVEFSPIVIWKNAICGLSYTRKCPKGKDCNFLHIFRNPGNAYNVSVFKQDESTRKINNKESRENSVMSWNDGDEQNQKRNWRWSESPEADARKISNGSRQSAGGYPRKDQTENKESSWSNSGRDGSAIKPKRDEVDRRFRSNERSSNRSSKNYNRHGVKEESEDEPKRSSLRISSSSTNPSRSHGRLREIIKDRREIRNPSRGKSRRQSKSVSPSRSIKRHKKEFRDQTRSMSRGRSSTSRSSASSNNQRKGRVKKRRQSPSPSGKQKQLQRRRSRSINGSSSRERKKPEQSKSGSCSTSRKRHKDHTEEKSRSKNRRKKKAKKRIKSRSRSVIRTQKRARSRSTSSSRSKQKGDHKSISPDKKLETKTVHNHS